MASSVTSRASFGSGSRLFSSIMRVSSAPSSEPQFTPMRTGLPYSMAASIMVRKLSSCFLPMLTLPGLMRYLASARAHAGILLQQQMAVVVEVADDGHAHAEHVRACRRSSAPRRRRLPCSR